MKGKTKFVVCCTIFLFIGVAGTIFVYNNFNLYKTKETKVTRVKITEKNTIKPPIERREKIDFFIAFPKISPKSDIFMGASFELNFVSLKFISNLFFFQKLKRYPTVRLAKI